MKKNWIFSVMLVTVCILLTLSAAALRVGDVVDYALATEIRAFFDGYELPAYNIGGRLGIVVEDLAGYGFSVEWNEAARTLTVYRKSNIISSPKEVERCSTIEVGTPIIPVLHTEIVTYLEGRAVESYNIDGRTIIYFSNLAQYGTYLYDNDACLSMISTRNHTFEKKTIDVLPKRIIHGGGEIDGFTVSNSLEAIENSYKKGHRIIEIDFVLSSDQRPVCLHDWSNYYSRWLTQEPLSKEEFEKIKIFGSYTALSLDSLAEWMKAHEDVYIVTDVKENNVEVLRHISEEHPEILKRIIPQIYQYEEYAHVRAMGYSNIILTLYRLPTYTEKADSKYNASFAQRLGLLAVTADKSLAKDDFVSDFLAFDVPLYLHTVNGGEEQQKYFDMGITGVYTDYAE